MAAKDTPLMKQYAQIKSRYPGAVLLFRVGDFYETFGEDAEVAAGILGITLTKRGNGSASEVKLAGFPHHALDNYLPKLVKAGQRVAVCDQLEDPKDAVGIVKRGVTELVTPGLSYHDHVLDTRANNYLGAVMLSEDRWGIALLDISTGQFSVAEGRKADMHKTLLAFAPAEILFPKPQKRAYVEFFGEEVSSFGLDDWAWDYESAYEKLTRHFGTSHLKGFGVEDWPLAISAAGAILHYAEQTQHQQLGHITRLSRIEQERHVWLDPFTIRNLELVFPLQEKGRSLIQTIDSTCTPMGARLLRNWVLLPLKDLAEIHARQAVVQALFQQDELRTSLQSLMSTLGDLERLVSKVAARRVNPRELGTLRNTLSQIAPLKEMLLGSGQEALFEVGRLLDGAPALVQALELALLDEPAANLSAGGYIRSGFDSELDSLRSLSRSGKDYLESILKREQERTQIPSLKISYNKVFGYYLEVTHTHRDKVPSDWIRKQTLVNAERYITPELKEYEEKIVTAESSILTIEQRLFAALVEQAAVYVGPIQQTAQALARLDVLAGFATLAQRYGYTQPVVEDSTVLDIREGRHPVIERQLPAGEPYIANDIYLDTESQQIIIITGPNMAGKSALLRQTALIVLLAQMGAYVPAAEAKVGLVDKIFTRVGASDNISRGESTFMVEMTETASILNNLSERSLVLLDEIGRGTSTYDGVSIAWAIVEHLHNLPQARARTLFATHYHELNELAESYSRIKNYNVSVKETGQKVLFLRKLQPGGSQHSFGIHVAQLAGMPNGVVLRAHEIMRQLEKDRPQAARRKSLQELPKSGYQMSFFEPAHPALSEVEKALKDLDINNLSPVQALLLVNEWKGKLAGK